MTERRCAFTNGGAAIDVGLGMRHGIIEDCRFENLLGDAVAVFAMESLLIANNWFLANADDSSLPAISAVGPDGPATEVSITGNFFSAGYRTGIGLNSLKGSLSLAHNSIEGGKMPAVNLVSLGGGDPR